MPHNDVVLLAVSIALGIAAAVFRSGAVIACFTLYNTYVLSIVIYRLFFHPLAKLPGPKLAAATYLYEFYYDILKAPGGQYTWKLEELHSQYGPILRVAPDEVEVNDAQFFDKVYVSGAAKRDRWERAGTGSTHPGATSSAPSHDLHRIRRSSLNNFFSKAAILRLTQPLQARIASFCQTLEDAIGSGKAVSINDTMSKLTLKVITEYAFGAAWDDQDAEFIEFMRKGFETLQFFKFFPILQSIPRPLVELIMPFTRSITQWENRICEEIERVRALRSQSESASSGRETLFSEVLCSKLPASEKETMRVRDEALILVIAGTESTSITLSYTVYHVLSDPEVLHTLQKELDKVFPDASQEIQLREAESLPYLTGVLKEALRLSSIQSGRSSLIAEQPLQYQEWVIPPGTATNVPFRDVLYNEEVFPEPTRFEPSRWLSSSKDIELRNRYFVAFSRGHRNCLGMNLAWAELYLTIANIFRRFELRLNNVDFERDVKRVRDCRIGFPSPGSKGVRVDVVGKRL